MPFIFTHYLLLIFIIWCDCLFTFHLFFCCCFYFFAWMLSTFIETHSVFVFTLSLPPPPPFSPTQAASQSKAQKKLQPLTQVPVLQEQGEYCAGVGGVWTWVPAVWSRGGRLGEGGGWWCFSSSLLHASVLSLNFHLSAHLQGWFVWWHHSHPFLTVPERCPTCRASIKREMWGSLWCVCASVHGLQRSVLAVCVCTSSWLH